MGSRQRGVGGEQHLIRVHLLSKLGFLLVILPAGIILSCPFHSCLVLYPAETTFSILHIGFMLNLKALCAF